MQSFLSTVVITVVVWSRFHVPFSVADESTWSLRLSNSGRDGRFLNVPIYYGDWVPITRAKQTIQAVASKIEAATKQYRDPPPEIITADQPEDRYVFFLFSVLQLFFFLFFSIFYVFRLDTIVPYDPSQNHHYATQHSHNQHHSQRLQPSFRPSSHQQQQQQQTQHHQSQWHHRPNLRRQPENTRTRGHRRLPPPSAHYNTNNHYQHQGNHEQWYHS